MGLRADSLTFAAQIAACLRAHSNHVMPSGRNLTIHPASRGEGPHADVPRTHPIASTYRAIPNRSVRRQGGRPPCSFVVQEIGRVCQYKTKEQEAHLPHVLVSTALYKHFADPEMQSMESLSMKIPVDAL